MGSHKRLKHGFVERIILSKPDLGENASDLSKQTFDLSKLTIDLSEQKADLSQNVRRPSDFIPKNTVVEKQILHTTETLNSLKQTVKAQSGIIKNQGKVIKTVMPEFVETSVEETEPEKMGKQLIETSADLSDHTSQPNKSLYTKQDLYILMAKLATTNWGQPVSPGVANLLTYLNAQKVTDNLIADFERRFQCKFEETKQANPEDMHGGDNDYWHEIIEQYSKLPYSM